MMALCLERTLREARCQTESWPVCLALGGKRIPPVAVSVVPEGIIGEFLAAGRTLTLVP